MESKPKDNEIIWHSWYKNLLGLAEENFDNVHQDNFKQTFGEISKLLQNLGDEVFLFI